MKNKHIKIGVISLAILFSCDHDLDKVNPNGYTVDNYYKNTDQLTTAVNGVYAVTQGLDLLGREWSLLHDTRSDDCSSGGEQLGADERAQLTGTLSASNGITERVWEGWYTLIGRANAVVDLAPNASGSESLKSRLVGEAKFLRAWGYFELAALFGPVPLYKNYVSDANGFLARSPIADVYSFVIQDLKDAQAVLPLASGYQSTDVGRATKGAAQAMLARVYMQMGNFADAKTELEKVISSNEYALTAKYMDNFLEETEYNKESLFEVRFDDSNGNFGWGNQGDGLTNGETTVRNQEYSPIAWRNLIPSIGLLNEFENTVTGDAMTDPRLHYSAYFEGDVFNNNSDTLNETDSKANNKQRGLTTTFLGVSQKISIRKYMLLYKSDNLFYPGGINARIIRYAGVLLMYAECLNELGDFAGAITQLNLVRARPDVNMPPYPTAKYTCSDATETFKAIMHEKRVEMAFEEVRNFDLLRWRKAGKFPAGSDPITYINEHPYLALEPIPQQEVDKNSLIGSSNQNTGY